MLSCVHQQSIGQEMGEGQGKYNVEWEIIRIIVLCYDIEFHGGGLEIIHMDT